MAWLDNLCLQLRSACDRRVEVIDFKPEKYAVSRRETGIPDRAVVMLDIPRMRLGDQAPIGHEPLVLRTTMFTVTTKKALIPTAACFHIADTNQRLWMHITDPSCRIESATLTFQGERDAFYSGAGVAPLPKRLEEAAVAA
jgi:hypothetical protein